MGDIDVTQGGHGAEDRKEAPDGTLSTESERHEAGGAAGAGRQGGLVPGNVGPPQEAPSRQ